MTDNRGWRWASELEQSPVPTPVYEPQHPKVYGTWPWGTVEIDPSTGLPFVPEEGMFWRVTPPFGGYWGVQLRKKLPIGSYKVEETYVLDSREPTRDNIITACAYVLKRYRGEFETEKEKRKRLAKVANETTGDYYPTGRRKV